MNNNESIGQRLECLLPRRGSVPDLNQEPRTHTCYGDSAKTNDQRAISFNIREVCLQLSGETHIDDERKIVTLRSVFVRVWVGWEGER